jgi:glycosyltransferase involved in cell wall biosynthesis
MRQPRFSVIMPLYNHEAFVGEAITSVLSQTFSDFELVICDDGSQDGSLEVASKYRDDRIIIVSKQNGGTVSALNACLLKSRGEFVCWLSSDDVYAPDKLKVHHDAHASNEIPVSIAPYGVMRGEVYSARRSIKPVGVGRLLQFLFGNYVNGLSICASRDMFVLNGPFDPRFRFAHDVDRWFEFIKSVEPVYLMGEPVSFTRLDSGHLHAHDPRLIGFIDVLKMLFCKAARGLECFMPNDARSSELARKRFAAMVATKCLNDNNYFYLFSFSDLFRSLFAMFLREYNLYTWLVDEFDRHSEIDSNAVAEFEKVREVYSANESFNCGEVSFFQLLVQVAKKSHISDDVKVAISHYLKASVNYDIALTR